MEEVPALNVNPVFVTKFIGDTLVSVTALLPKFIVRVFKLLELKPDAVTIALFVVNVPCVITMLSVTLILSARLTVIPDPLTIKAPPNVLPALVIVAVPTIVKFPE